MAGAIYVSSVTMLAVCDGLLDIHNNQYLDALPLAANTDACSYTLSLTSQVAVALPDIAGRRDILNYYLEGKPVAADVDRELLARQTQGELVVHVY